MSDDNVGHCFFTIQSTTGEFEIGFVAKTRDEFLKHMMNIANAIYRDDGMINGSEL